MHGFDQRRFALAAHAVCVICRTELRMLHDIERAHFRSRYAHGKKARRKCQRVHIKPLFTNSLCRSLIEEKKSRSVSISGDRGNFCEIAIAESRCSSAVAFAR